LEKKSVVTTVLIAVMAFSLGIAVSPYLLSLRIGSEAITVTNLETMTTTVNPTSSNLLYSSSTSVLQSITRTTTSQHPKWISSSTNVIPYLQAGSYVGQSKTVEGTIVYTFVSSGTIFLDFHYPYQGYFYAVIFASDAKNFNFSPASFYLNKEVRTTGTIQLYQGSPEIIVRSPSQIEVSYIGFSYP
jgi:DNA/RNA endonuclease YhcR with UshA esterase domain